MTDAPRVGWLRTLRDLRYRLGCWGACGPGCLVTGVAVLGVAWFVLAAVYRLQIGNHHLYRAIAEADTAQVRRLLAEGADPNLVSQGKPSLRTRWKTGRQTQSWHTPLIFAVETQQPAIVRMLLDHGADVHRSLSYGGMSGDRWPGPTALAAAVRGGDLPMVELLLAHGARVTDRTNSEGLPIACDAAESGHAAILRALLARGADANTRCRGGRSLLATARAADRPTVVEVLRRAGARE